MLKLYWTDVSDLPELDPALFSDYRKEKLSRIRHEMTRKSAVGVELLLIRALRETDSRITPPLPIAADEYGKPYLTQGGVRFNLSHSEQYAACAVSDAEIGLDVQILSPWRESLVQRLFTVGEAMDIRAANDPDAAFTALWCRKESFLKATGLGLRLLLSAFDLSGDSPTADYRGISYEFRECRIGELFFCLCAERGALPERLTPEFVSCRELAGLIRSDPTRA